VVLRNRIQRFDDEKLKILVKNSYFLKFKNLATYLPLDLNEGRPRYKRSFQPSKENIQHFTTIHFFTFSFFMDHLCPPGSESGSTSLMPTKINAYPCGSGSGFTALPFTAFQ
jgi:hypothetical protein